MQGIKNLTQGPINKQLFNLAMPIMATSFIQMAYSLTDMAWVGRLGSEAVAAVGSVGILTWMSGSISLLNKVGSEVSVVSPSEHKIMKMPVISPHTTLLSPLLFHFAGVDCFSCLHVPSSVSTNWKHISPKMQSLICA